jgi:hypothetical protein
MNKFLILSNSLLSILGSGTTGQSSHMRIFPVFHSHLLRPKTTSAGLPGQAAINEAESRNIRGRILEREDGIVEPAEKGEFDKLLDCHNEDGLHYFIN